MAGIIFKHSSEGAVWRLSKLQVDNFRYSSESKYGNGIIKPSIISQIRMLTEMVNDTRFNLYMFNVWVVIPECKYGIALL